MTHRLPAQARCPVARGPVVWFVAFLIATVGPAGMRAQETPPGQGKPVPLIQHPDEGKMIRSIQFPEAKSPETIMRFL